MNKDTKKKNRRKIGGFLCPILPFLAAVSLFGCGIGHNLPPQTSTTISVRDSVAVHYIDSIRITEATRYKDMAWLGDSLKIEGQRSRMWAYADTTKEAIIGGLEEQPVKEHYKVIYKDKIVVRDSIQRVEVPVEVEKIVEKRYIPWYSKLLSAIGLISILFFGLKLYLRFRNAGRL